MFGGVVKLMEERGPVFNVLCLYKQNFRPDLGLSTNQKSIALSMPFFFLQISFIIGTAFQEKFRIAELDLNCKIDIDTLFTIS